MEKLVIKDRIDAYGIIMSHISSARNYTDQKDYANYVAKIDLELDSLSDWFILELANAIVIKDNYHD